MTHNSQHQIRLYRVNTDLEQLKIHTRLLKILDNFSPSNRTLESIPPGYERAAGFSRLSFLTLISSGPESKTRAPVPPSIVAAFSYLADDFQAGGEHATVICKLDIRRLASKLHASFDPLSSKNVASRGLPSVSRIRLLSTRLMQAFELE